MPIFTINTNLPKSKFPSNFSQTTAEILAELLNKPVSYIVVCINPDQIIHWAGSSEPCALVKILSIGSLGKEENKIISGRISAHIKSTLGIKDDMMYIIFEDIDRSNVGWSGTTFAYL